jgi:solute carrier family 50 protein (sugar transporter)
MQTKDRQMAIMLFFTFAIALIGACGTLSGLSQPGLKSLWGFTSNAILLLYYAAPLSTILTVLRTRCSATLHPGLAVMQLINGGSWVGYGLAVSDPFIWVPNAVGTVTGTVLIALIVAFPRKPRVKSSPAPSEAGGSQRALAAGEGGGDSAAAGEGGGDVV